MSTRKMTGLFIVLGIVIAGAYDVYAFVAAGTEGTISHVVMSWGYDYPAFTFSLGFLFGHFFWRIREVKPKLAQPDKK